MLWEHWPLLVLGHIILILKTFHKHSLKEREDWGLRFIPVRGWNWDIKYALDRTPPILFQKKLIILGFSCQDRFFRLLGWWINGFNAENTLHEAKSSHPLPGIKRKIEKDSRSQLLKCLTVFFFFITLVNRKMGWKVMRSFLIVNRSLSSQGLLVRVSVPWMSSFWLMRWQWLAAFSLS